MGNHAGNNLTYKQEEAEKMLSRAKAECEFSDHLYNLIFNYQERLSAVGNKTWARPLRESERVGGLNLPLSRLYNQIWALAFDLNDKTRSKKKDK